MIVLEPIQASIWHCLNHYAYSDAVFLAERLHDEVETDENLYLLATCYYRWGKTNQAYSLLKNKPGITRNAQCRFLFARCAWDLKKYGEAESAICGSALPLKINCDDIVSQFGEHDASFVLQLLARILTRTEQMDKANEVYLKALKLNPFLWTCFEEMCRSGAKVKAKDVFQVSHLTNFTSCHGSTVPGLVYTSVVTDSNANSNTNKMNTSSIAQSGQLQNSYTSTPVACTKLNNLQVCYAPKVGSLFAPESPIGVSPWNAPNRVLFGCDNYFTPTFGIQPLESSSPYSELANSLISTNTTINQSALTDANDQKRHAQNASEHVADDREKANTPNQIYDSIWCTNKQNNRMFKNSAIGSVTPTLPGVRRSTRLFSNSVKENNKSPARNNNQNAKFISPKSPSRKTKQRIAKTTNLNSKNSTLNTNSDINAKNANVDKTKLKSGNETAQPPLDKTSGGANASAQNLTVQKKCAEGLMVILRKMGEAYSALSEYECSEAIELFEELSEAQMNSCWVMSQIAIAYAELERYHESMKYFEMVHRREPCRFDYMDVYSTVLWHLQKEVALSKLSQDLVSIDKNHPVTWCVAGNCFSLQKEHDTAIKLFERAVQVDPKFSYAHSLLGHEYVTSEELDKAEGCFRNAIQLEPRDYKAWFGLGTVFFKQEIYQSAEYHYRRALSINKRSSVTLCHISVVQHALKRPKQALETLNVAITMNPNNPKCKFHRASIYYALGRHAEALEELSELKQTVPRESDVYYLIGKIHKKLGNAHEYLKYFSWASDLDPKGANNQMRNVFEPSQTSMADTTTNTMDDELTGVDANQPSTSSFDGRSRGDSIRNIADDSDESL